MLLEGAHLVREALEARVPIEAVLTDGRLPELTAALERAQISVVMATAGVVDAASPARTPSGVVALARWRPASISDVLAARGLVLALVDVQDPGNLGAVIRAADAFGAAGVLALGDSADPAGWKALRGAMGSAFRMPVARGSLAEALALARSSGHGNPARPVLATVASGGRPLQHVDLAAGPLVLLGREGSGLPADVIAGADACVTIPMRASVNSLNVSVAAAVIAYEARRGPA